jgi:cell division protein FtsW (lipid II flippase)
LIGFLMGAFFFWYNFFHQSYKSHSRECGLYWASGGCFLLLMQSFSNQGTKLI